MTSKLFSIKNKQTVYPEVTKEGLELWYDAKGKSNSDTHRDTLVDMGPKKNHGELHNFAYEKFSGYKKGLVFDGIDDKLIRPVLDGLNPDAFTYQLNSNTLAFDGDEVRTVKNGDIEIGGRNYWAIAKKPWCTSSLSHQGDGLFTNIDVRSSYALFRMDKLEVPVGETYTVSFEINVSDDTIQFLNDTFYVNGANPGTKHNKPTLVKDKWVKVFATPNYTVENTGLVHIYIDGISAINTFQIRNFQLEKGTKATDWTPAPEDLIEATELKGNILGDMEDIVDDLDRDIMSGTEIYTDKADDSAVHVEIDGKSYQHAGSGENLMPLQGWDLSGDAYVDEDSGYVYSSFSNFAHSPYIKIKPNTDYTYSHYGRPHRGSLQFLDINKDLITSEISWGGVGTLSSPDNAYYFIRIGYDSSGQTELEGFRFQLEEGSIATEYEPPAPSPEYPIKINSLNNFDVVSQKSEGGAIDGIEVGGRNLILSSEVLPATFINTSGNEARARFTGQFSTGYISVKAGEFFTISMLIERDGYSRVAYFDSEKIFIKRDLFQNQEVMQIIPEQDGFIRWSPDADGGEYKQGYKIEKGNKATYWTPAPEDITEADNHPLIDKINLLLDEPLRSVGDVKDRLFRDSDELWKVERNVGEVILDGAENWNQGSDSLTDVFRYFSSSISMGSESRSADIGICSHLKTNPSTMQNQEGAVFGMSNMHPYLFLNKTKYPTTESVKNWVLNESVKGSPVVLQFRLEASTIETLDQELQDRLNNLRSFEDSNYIYTMLDKSSISSSIEENLKPTLHARFLAADWYKENRLINTLLIYSKALTENELLTNYNYSKKRFGI